MAFWGVEVKPGKPYIHSGDPSAGRLRITQATVGSGSSTKRILLQCNVGKRSPILLCSLIPDKTESCGLDLEFAEEDNVIFSVIGPRSVHLAGYTSSHGKAGGDDDDTVSYGEDIGETETDGSGSFDSEDEYEDDFINDGDVEIYDSDSSSRPNSGVIIEEIIGDVKQGNGDIKSHRSKKNRVERSDDKPDSACQPVSKRNRQIVLDSEDEDDFPISSLLKRKISGESNCAGKEIDHGSFSQPKSNEDINAVSDSAGKNREQEIDKTGKSLVEKIEDMPKKLEKHKKRKKEGIKKVGVESADNILADQSKDDASKDENERDDKEANAVDMKAINTKQKRNLTTETEVWTLSNIDETAETKSRKKLDKVKKKKRFKEKISDETEDTTGLDENGRDNIQDTDDRVAKKRKKSKKSKEVGKIVQEVDGEKTLPIEEEEGTQPQLTRVFSNGVVLDEIQMGRPDRKKATSGKR